MGFTGVILAYYGKKTVNNTTTAIEQCMDGNLQTVDMLDEQDFLAV